MQYCEINFCRYTLIRGTRCSCLLLCVTEARLVCNSKEDLFHSIFFDLQISLKYNNAFLSISVFLSTSAFLRATNSLESRVLDHVFLTHVRGVSAS